MLTNPASDNALLSSSSLNGMIIASIFSIALSLTGDWLSSLVRVCSRTAPARGTSHGVARRIGLRR